MTGDTWSNGCALSGENTVDSGGSKTVHDVSEEVSCDCL